MQGDISTAAMVEELQALADAHVGSIDVLTVPDIQSWCRERNVVEDNPFRCGKALRQLETGRCVVLLADPISPAMRASVLGAMDYSNVDSAHMALLQEPIAFVRHLVLHEVAHVLNPEQTEEECDRWAFTQLGGQHEA
jgi:hypothetical protein